MFDSVRLKKHCLAMYSAPALVRGWALLGVVEAAGEYQANLYLSDSTVGAFFEQMEQVEVAAVCYRKVIVSGLIEAGLTWIVKVETVALV